jgi:hypothetical protein
MKTTPDQPCWEQDLRLQRLVDGELDEQQSRQLLAELDRDPAGWRACALAFLEAQLWSAEMQAPPPTAPPQVPAAASHSKASHSTASHSTASHSTAANLTAGHHRFWNLAVLAAAASVAFVVGLRLNGLPPNNARPAARPAATANEFDAGQPREQLASQTTLDEQLGPPLGELSLLVGGPEQGQNIAVPVFAPSPAYEQQIMQRPELPPELLRRIEASGRQLRRQTYWTPVALEGGSEVLVPIEQYDLAPDLRLIP